MTTIQAIHVAEQSIAVPLSMRTIVEVYTAYAAVNRNTPRPR